MKAIANKEEDSSNIDYSTLEESKDLNTSSRGRGDGEYRGRGRGDFEYRGRGDGEYRGRGRGDVEYRGRGDGNYRVQQDRGVGGKPSVKDDL